VQRAQREGHLRPEVDAAQLAFELESYSMGANWAYQLFGDAGAFERARRAAKALLDGAAVHPTHRSDSARRKPAAHRD